MVELKDREGRWVIWKVGTCGSLVLLVKVFMWMQPVAEGCVLSVPRVPVSPSVPRSALWTVIVHGELPTLLNPL